MLNSQELKRASRTQDRSWSRRQKLLLKSCLVPRVFCCLKFRQIAVFMTTRSNHDFGQLARPVAAARHSLLTEYPTRSVVFLEQCSLPEYLLGVGRRHNHGTGTSGGGGRRGCASPSRIHWSGPCRASDLARPGRHRKARPNSKDSSTKQTHDKHGESWTTAST